jgi:hypothetical protein
MKESMKELIILSEIEKEKSRLVEKAESFLDENYPNNLTDTQIRNLLNVASNTLSMEVLLNFLKYQIGRESKWQEKDIGEKLISELEGLSENRNTILKHLKEKDIEVSLQEQQQIAIQLARLYLGFLNRYFKYKSE